MKNKRFIAGAQCPSCKEFDKVFTYENDDKKFRACVRCDFREELRFVASSAEVGTRVNRTLDEREKEVQTVRLMDPSK